MPAHAAMPFTLLANLIELRTDEGKTVYVAKDNIAVIEEEPGEPDEPAVEAQDEVPDDPGAPANNITGFVGRAPVKGSPKREAKPAKAGKPAVTTIKLKTGGDVTIKAKAKDIAALVG
ncbi:MAG: hypothetical protein C5B60_07095 [Chloroflexi bacterium]|nr:MAG: hypothetical protein C5B60_07095 [Chloroflexota bacterium]